MELSVDFIQAIHNVVLRPDFTTAFMLFLAALINELFAVLPYHLILSGQLFFIDGSDLTIPFFAKLLVYVALPVSLGATIGSLATFALVYFGGRPAILKFGKYFRLKWENVENWSQKFKGVWYDEIIFLFIRSIPLLPSLPVNAAAGLLRMPFFRYIIFTAVGTLIKVMVLFALTAWGIFGIAQ